MLAEYFHNSFVGGLGKFLLAFASTFFVSGPQNSCFSFYNTEMFYILILYFSLLLH
jgi:hypothetical protein